MSKVSPREKKEKHSETEEITILLNKFTKDDLITSVFETPLSNNYPSIKSKKKPLVIKQAIKILTEKFTNLDELILFLHLRYILTQKLKKAWNIVEIKNAKRFSNPSLAPESVSTSIHKYFTKYSTECKVISEKKDNCLWIIMILENNKSKPVYCAAHMKLSLIFICNLKPDYLLLTQKVLRKTFRGSEIEELTSFRANADEIQRLNIKSWRVLLKKLGGPTVKKATEDIKSKTKVIENSHCQIDADLSLQSQDERVEGNEMEVCVENDKLPIIENLKYRVMSAGIDMNERDSVISHCIVKFQGTDILKGLNTLVDFGQADTPLPDYLYQEPKTGKTVFNLTG